MLGGPQKEFLNLENKSRRLEVPKYVYFYPLANAYRDKFSLENEVSVLVAKTRFDLYDDDIPMCKAETMMNFDTSKNGGVSDNDDAMDGGIVVMNSDADPAIVQMSDTDVRIYHAEGIASESLDVHEVSGKFEE